MMRHMLSLCLVLLAASRVAGFDGQTGAPPPPLAFPPPASGITVASDVEYGRSGTTRLAMDVYSPATASGVKVPALVFFNRATGADHSGRFYAAWARAAASKGLIGILPDLRTGSEAADFRVLLSYLERHASDHGIDSIAVHAGSGNVFTAFPVVEDPALTAIKAAVMYYGSAEVRQFRLDLPVLYVRAGLDRPGVNESIARLAALAVAQNAPLTLLNYAGGHHGFEIADDNDATRQVIDDTLDFVTRATSPRYQSALRSMIPEATLPATCRRASSTKPLPRMRRWSRRVRTTRGCGWRMERRCSAMVTRRSPAPSSTSCATRGWGIAISACRPRARACRRAILTPRSRG
jgi:dienelactone hydrolase